MTRRRASTGCLATLLALSLCIVGGAPASAAPNTWSVVTSPNLGTAANELTSVSCATATSCMAVGYSNTAAGVRHTLAEGSSGGSWALTPIPNRGSQNNTLQGVSCTSPTSCVAVGSSITTSGVLQTLVERWNGTTWSITSSPAGGALAAELDGVSCTGPSYCVAVGYSEDAFGGLHTLVETWEGTTWAVTPAPSPAASDDLLTGVSCTSPTSCVAVGYSVNGIGGLLALVESWDGNTWAVTPTPTNSTSKMFTAVSCTSPTNCVAVGWSTVAAKQTAIERWNGRTWSTVASPNRGSLDNRLSGVSCTSSTSCVAVGSNDSATKSQTLIETWNGTAWTITPSPNTGTITWTVNGVACPIATTCIATGTQVPASVKRSLVLSAVSPNDVTAPTISLSTPSDGAYYVTGQAVAANYSCADEPTGSGVHSCIGTVPDASPIDTSAPGVQSFSVTATDEATNSSTADATYSVADPVSASADLPPGGGSITTDPGAGPTPLAPIASTITSVDEGTIGVDQGAVTLTPPAGFNVLGMQMDVVAPAADPSTPVTSVFDVDAAMLPAGTTPDQVSLLKDAALVPDCSGATSLPVGTDACVTDRSLAPSDGGDVRVTAISLGGGQWNIATGSAAPPSLTIANVTKPEGNSGTSIMQFPVALSQPSALPVTVHYASGNYTATAGTDYIATSGDLNFTPGQVAAQIPVTIRGDTTVENDESLTVTLSSPTGATIARAAAFGTIVDDDSTVPGPPSGVGATPGDASAVVSWAAPTHNGGRTVGGYVVTAYIGGVAQTLRTFTNPLTIHAITGLTNGASYTFKVAATNARGTGAKSAASVPVTIGAPAAPFVTAVGSSGTGRVSWLPPSGNGHPVTSYVLKVYLAGVEQTSKRATLTCRQPCTPPATWTVTGLSNDHLYSFLVTAQNTNGSGPPGLTRILVSAHLHAPAAPAAPKASVVSIGVFLSWSAPSSGTASISNYVITPYRNGVAQATSTVPAQETSYYELNLTEGASYTFRIAAMNAAGLGPQSPASKTVTAP